MKKLFLTFLIFSLATETFAATWSILRPSLEAQMKLQTAQNIKVSNAQRIAELRAQKAVKNTPTTSTSSSNRTAAQQANIARLAALRAERTNGTSTNAGTIQQTSKPTNQPSIPSVDIDQVRSTWLGWYNDVRKGMWRSPYTYDARLDNTAYAWNQVFANGKGQNHHRRNPWDSYYDYPVITEWFRDRGVVGKVVSGATTTENVGWGTYACSSSDCTGTLIASIRSTFDFFMSEKSYNGAHYRSVVSSAFTKIGLSVIVVPSERRYYLTVHYITEFQ
jgi:hypothetical protein